MSTIGRRELLMLLFRIADPDGSRGLGGITRIQKLLFLLDREEKIKLGPDGFKFEAYKAGPYSPRVYDDLEFLENREYLSRTEPSERKTKNDAIAGAEPSFAELVKDEPEASDAEKEDIDITFEELMGPADLIAPGRDEIRPTPDSYEESRYFLTPKGKEKVEALLASKEYQPFVDGIRKIQSRFAKYSLNDLLYYVYTKYPDMTTESEIKEKVLRRRPS
jgi:hypothetical protein